MAMTKLEQAHQEADHLFRNLLLQQGMAVREGQVSLCHTMLDALFRRKLPSATPGWALERPTLTWAPVFS